MNTPVDRDAEHQLAGFLARFTPEIAALGERAITRMRRRLPGANLLVYDNYNALAVGFSPSEKSSQGVFSIAIFPRRVALFLLRGAAMPDPHGIFEGAGNQMRNITLDSVARLDHPHVAEAIDEALERNPIPGAPPGRLIIKSISAKQRPRRPVGDG